MRLASALFALALLTIAAPARAEPDTEPDLVHVHASQRYDRSLALLGRAVRTYARPPVSLLTLTEVQAPRRRAVAHRPGDGWAGYTDARTDVAIMWRLDRWRAVHRATRLVTGRTFVTTGGYTKRTYALAVVLAPRDGTGPRVLVTVAHLPSGIESGDRFRPTLRAAVWRSSLAGWASWVRDLRARYRPGAVVTTGDWNVNVRRPAWRRIVRAAFPAQRLTWQAPLPRRGTHAGGRLIDATLTTLTGRARLLPHTAASDHTAYRERLSLDDRRPKGVTSPPTL